jgi:hypothetical protein
MRPSPTWTSCRRGPRGDRRARRFYVVTPALPGRLARLADNVDRFRHVAGERLDTVPG